MRHFYLALATTVALGTAAVPASAAETPAASSRVAAPLAALQNGDLQTSYAQWRGRHYGHRGYYGRPGYYGPRHGYYGRPYYRRDYGSAAAAGAIGLATGAIIGGALAQQQAAPVYSAPNSSVSYCMQRFKSYDPASGTYLGYDGVRHPCP
ncbi:BA14K family protein [Microvirga sp. 17 mud 1-3]|uniref:BA14K family protein n=1 Tax=Microvirga sp. 17 mud 1-3 TaxID=2082949 RepID=UPI000D6C6AA1|nr:BA14K family protein [Microvirga sp. 17 mud 1-3]AWM88809.1 BA14K family protein [Microvirga sp. 17 mud 1-3]